MLLRRLVYFLLLLAISSCSLFRKVPAESEEVNSLRSAVNLHLSETNKVNRLLIENASFSVETDKKISAKITLFAEKGEQIFGSIRFLGFEIARFKMTQDSLFYINRVKKEYLFTNIESVSASTGFSIDFNLMQNLLFTGFPDIPDNRNHEFYKLAKIQNDSLIFPYQINPDNEMTASYSFPGLKLLKMDYSDIPSMTRANVDIMRKGKDVSSVSGLIQKETLLAKFDMEIGEISYTKYSKTKFKIGRNYKEISYIF